MKFIKVITLILALILVLTACGGASQEVVSGEYMFATGKAGGTYYSLGTCFAGVWDKYTQSTTNIATTTGSINNIEMLLKGDADFGFVQSDILYYATEGQEMYEENKQRGISVVGNLYTEAVQIVTNASSDIYTIPELAGKTVAVGKYGTATEAAARKILEAYGITYDMITVKYQSFSEASDDLSSGRIQAAFAVSALPSTNILEYAKTHELRFLPVSTTQSTAFRRTCPFFKDGMIPSDVYGSQNSVSTVCIDILLICRSNLQTANVYSVTKALFDNRDEVAAGHIKGGDVNPITAGSTLVGSFHAGAKQYYDTMDDEEPAPSESSSSAVIEPESSEPLPESSEEQIESSESVPESESGEG